MSLIVVAIYLVSVILIGFWVSGSNRSTEQYSLGGRNIPSWAMGLSVLGTFTSSITFMGVPQKAYSENWSIFWFGAAQPLAAWIAVRSFIPLYRRLVEYSAYEFLEQRFGLWARLYGAVSYIVIQMVRTATVLLLVSFAVSPLLNVPILPTLMVLGLVVIVYDTVGGLQAVVWTDVMQVIVLTVGSLWCLAILVSDAGGAAAFWNQLPASKISFGAWDKLTQSPLPWYAIGDWTRGTLLVVFLYGLSENLRNYGTDENYVQRYLATDSDQSAIRSLWLGSLSYVPLSIVFLLIGSGLSLAYPTPPLVDGKPILADQVFPYFIQRELHPLASGLVVAAIMAAAMSTIDSCLNATSTVILTDFVKRLRPEISPRHELLVLRFSTVFFGLAGTAAAAGLYLVYQKSASGVTDLWWQYAGTAGGGLFGLFLVAWLLPRTYPSVALVGVVTTLPVLAWGTFLRNPASHDWYARFACTLHPNLIGIAATCAMLVVVVALNALWGVRPAAVPQTSSARP